MIIPKVNPAGEALGTVPSALVTQVARLETDIGAPLFHRGAKTKNGTPMTPTERRDGLVRHRQARDGTRTRWAVAPPRLCAQPSW
ncbi:helix-turn-helix domain-containing protein [Kitasatospora sp. NPDC001683]